MILNRVRLFNLSRNHQTWKNGEMTGGSAYKCAEIQLRAKACLNKFTFVRTYQVLTTELNKGNQDRRNLRLEKNKKPK